MPWNHCEHDFILDDEDCPTCGFTKAEWTVQLGLTREFQVSGKTSKKAASADWIELEVRDSLGEPATEQAFRLLLPDGRQREGATDATGSARLEELPAGDCQVVFPDFGPDETASSDALRFVTKAEAGAMVATGARHAVELSRALDLELVDAAGSPLSGYTYTVTLPDGSTRTGSFDAEGRAREDGIPAGACDLVVERAQA